MRSFVIFIYFLHIIIYVTTKRIGGEILNFKINRNFSSEIKKANDYMKDNVLSSVHIEMKSNRELILEGCQKIEEYDENIVKIKVPKMCISVFGRNLELRCLTPDSLVVSGFISSVEFLS